jgi:GntR family transcriptional regulator, transcriptional repressor for pyruvate dehydrogenase complex
LTVDTLTLHDQSWIMANMSTKRIADLGTADHVLDHKDDLTHLLILRFQQMLSDGVLTPGTKLPPERELAAYFKVARSSLRQALKVLEILGVITQKVGDGSYLNPDASLVLAVPMEFLFLLDDTTVEELSEFRFIMEPALAAKAAERANSADIALLHQSIADLENSQGDPLKLVASDLLFHRAIFQASGNRLTGRLFHTIHRAMLNMITMTSKLVDIEHTAAFHKTILGAIEKRDGESASRLMTAHLVDASALLAQGRQRERERTLRDHMATNSSSLMKTTGEVPERHARQSARFLRRRPSPTGGIPNLR